VRTKVHLLLVVGLSLFLFAGCSDDGIGRSVMEVVSVNDGAPVVDAQLDPGGDQTVGTPDDVVPEGSVKVTVRNRAYNEFTTATETDPFGAFVIDRVTVQWQPLVLGTAADQLPAYDRAFDFSQVVKRGTDAEFTIPLVTFDMKSQPFLQGLISGDPPFFAQAKVTFTGHESGSTSTIYSFGASIPVQFIGVIAN